MLGMVLLESVLLLLLLIIAGTYIMFFILGTFLSILYLFNIIVIIIIPQGKYDYNLCLTDEETKSQKGFITYLRPRS